MGTEGVFIRCPTGVTSMDGGMARIGATADIAATRRDIVTTEVVVSDCNANVKLYHAATGQ